MASNTSHKPAQEAAPRKSAILVLGMHRSGTSALTGLLDLFGAATPKQQIPASAQNARGFFEATKIARLNDALLDQDALTWDSWTPLPERAEDATFPADLTDQACEILQEEFGNASLIALKDPRICRLVPFWANALRAWDRDPFFLLATRNPIEVAQSLNVRNDFEIPHGLLLWMTYVLEAEASTRGHPRTFSTYDLLMREPQTIVTQLHSKLGTSPKALSKKKQAQVDAFLSPELRHHESGDLSGLPPVFGYVYSLMTRWGQTGEDATDHPFLDRIQGEFAALSAQNSTSDALLEALHFIGQDVTEPALSKQLAALERLKKPELLAKIAPLLRAHAALSTVQTQTQDNPAQSAHMKSAIQHHNQAMDRAEKAARAHAREMATLSQMLVQAKSEAAQFERAAQGNDARVATLEEDLRTLRKRLTDDQAALGATTRENAELHALVAQVETARARLHDETIGLTAMLERVEEERAELVCENHELHGVVRKVETDRTRLHGDNIGLNAMVARVETERKRLADENTELHALVQRVETQRHALASSMSWRLSRPVRLIGRVLRKLRS